MQYNIIVFICILSLISCRKDCITTCSENEITTCIIGTWVETHRNDGYPLEPVENGRTLIFHSSSNFSVKTINTTTNCSGKYLLNVEEEKIKFDSDCYKYEYEIVSFDSDKLQLGYIGIHGLAISWYSKK
ncbi:MAG: hypothetical protein LC107_04175 [Chitinophagales bacterium]|nr:hypothetical protein [Chitinophagales bacterium]